MNVMLKPFIENGREQFWMLYTYDNVTTKKVY